MLVDSVAPESSNIFMPGIFICYRREDSAGHAGRLFDRLVEHFGNDRVFLDVAGIEPGLDFVEAIEEAVGSSDAVVVVIGREWLNCTDAQGRRRLEDPKDFIRLEVATALRRDIRVIPVLVQGASTPDSQYLPQDLEKLSRRQAIELSDNRWDSDVSLCIENLKKIVSVPSSSTKSGKTSVEKQPPPSDMAVLDPTPSNDIQSITYHGHQIVIRCGALVDKVWYDGREVSSISGFATGTTHVFTVSEDGNEAYYQIIIWPKSFSWEGTLPIYCEFKRNGKIIFAHHP